MRRLFTLSLFALQCFAATFAQEAPTGFTGNGYYRIHNKGTDRYIYVTDNKDYYDKTKDKEDFQAIQLWKDPNKAISDPASVIYIEEVSSGAYDLKAQGTGVRALTGYLVSVTDLGNGVYEVSASKEGVTKYLSDDRTNASFDQGKMGTSAKLVYRQWIVDRINTAHSINYFGIKPTIKLGDKYYQPFFADFPFKVASPNMHIYYINKVSGSNAFLKEIDGDVPAQTPVIIECESAEPTENRLELLSTTSAKITDNKLVGVFFCNGERPEQSKDAYTKFDASTMRIFSVSNDKLIMTNDDPARLTNIETLDWTTEQEIELDCIPANTCYFKADAGTPSKLNIYIEGQGIDEIIAKNTDNAIAGVYTITGSRLRATNDVNGLPAGLYIVGGVKVAIK